ncbi:6-phosphogluconolactonase [Pseudohoeflea suaedae]|uniref:6-phosphogluconolactonase n=1 Tax=Pseudohoeflea suaedae TaxID=877384 RepID=A0A4R5PSG2_9HYPH|nr:6-phosphogluconolactonase [Pseudohoeflea suaedae]TDH39417.1 6-phosphogluconolactonase [Pseudohoeflea suaedae]
MKAEMKQFDDRAALASGLAAAVAKKLSAAIEKDGDASLAVSGGSTPKKFFEELSHARIDWSKVTVTLVDDRMVPPDHERSNERLAYEHLLTNEAMKAKFVPLWSDLSDHVDTLAEHASKTIGHIERPFDVVILGMGTDGHTASFFPEGNNLRAAIDPDGKTAVISMLAPGAGEPRLTITLPRLVEADMLVLHIEGDEKLSVLEKAREGGPEEEMPIRAVLSKAPRPVTVYWAP